MRGDFAIMGAELAAELVKAGFELVETKSGKLTKIYYFTDSKAFREKLLQLEGVLY